VNRRAFKSEALAPLIRKIALVRRMRSGAIEVVRMPPNLSRPGWAAILGYSRRTAFKRSIGMGDCMGYGPCGSSPGTAGLQAASASTHSVAEPEPCFTTCALFQVPASQPSTASRPLAPAPVL
jgi:hypothetical protein